MIDIILSVIRRMRGPEKALLPLLPQDSYVRTVRPNRSFNGEWTIGGSKSGYGCVNAESREK